TENSYLAKYRSRANGSSFMALLTSRWPSDAVLVEIMGVWRQRRPGALAANVQRLILMDVGPAFALDEVDHPVGDHLRKPQPDRSGGQRDGAAVNQGVGRQPVEPGDGGL